MASLLERTLSNYEHQNQKNITAAAKGNTSGIKAFAARDSMMPPAFAHIDEHKQQQPETVGSFINRLVDNY
jgi:hypothetical protein